MARRRGRRARARAARARGRARRSPAASAARAARRAPRSCARARRRSRPARRPRRRASASSSATAATSSISVRSVWWPTEAMTGTRSSATVRHSVSSQNANRSASEPPPRATTITSTSSQAARSCSARVIAGAAWRSCTGANAHTSRPAQPRRRRPASTSSRALPPSPETTPIVRGSDGRAQPLLRLEQALVGERRRSRSSWASRSPSPATRSFGDREGERRRARRASRGRSRSRRRRPRRAPSAERVEARARPSPCATSSTAARRGVAQLEVDLRPPDLEAEDLAEHLHAREAAQAVAQRRGVLADGPGPGQRGCRGCRRGAERPRP